MFFFNVFNMSRNRINVVDDLAIKIFRNNVMKYIVEYIITNKFKSDIII